MAHNLTATSADGTEVRAYDEGRGPAIVIVGPGLDDGTRTAKLAGLLTSGFRVVRIVRRTYRTDLTEGRPFPAAREVDDVLAVVRAIGRDPVLVYGHSSGAVIALEAVLEAPESFAGAVVFEPAASTPGRPIGGPDHGHLDRAREAIAAGKPGRAMRIFLRDVVELPPFLAGLAGLFVTISPRYKRLIGEQIDDLAMMDALGVRLDAYAGIATPLVMLYGDRSPANLIDRAKAVHAAIPGAELTVLPGRDHGADLKAPAEVARVIEGLAAGVLP